MTTSPQPLRVLVLCTGNSCRSQMTEGWLRHFGGAAIDVHSAGLEAHGVNPYAIIVMGEAGIDISGHTSDLVSKYEGQDFDIVLTVCGNAEEQCPAWLGKAIRLHEGFADPAKATGTPDEILQAFRKVRDEVREYSRGFVAKYCRS